jgi:hypothetical protein
MWAQPALGPAGCLLWPTLSLITLPAPAPRRSQVLAAVSPRLLSAPDRHPSMSMAARMAAAAVATVTQPDGHHSHSSGWGHH